MKSPFAPALFFLLLSVSPAFADNPASAYTELADAPTITVDWSKANTQAVTLHGNRALVFENGQNSLYLANYLMYDPGSSRLFVDDASNNGDGNNRVMIFDGGTLPLSTPGYD